MNNRSAVSLSKYCCIISVFMITLFCTTGGHAMDITSKDFQHNQSMPSIHTCDGTDISPQLAWAGAPEGTKSFALTCIDPDAPMGNFIHWLVYNIPAKASELPQGGPLPAGAQEVANDFGKKPYGGPCPPPGKPHRYFFRLYALDTVLNLKPGAGRNEIERALKGHVVAQAELMGTFRR